MDNPLISVIVPIYKVEPYLRQCLDSIVNQTYTNLEIILVDDGSPDGCPAICDEYAAKEDRIIVIHKENGGLSDARNAGLDICRGEYIYFVDSDDYIGSEAIQTLFDHLKDHPNAVIAIGYCTAVCNGENKIYNKSWIFSTPKIIEASDFADRMLTEKSNHAAWQKLYRKKLFQNIRFQVGKKNEDTLLDLDLIPLIESKNYQCIDVPTYSYYYRLRDESICRSKDDPFEWHIINNCETIIAKLNKRRYIVNFLRNRELDLMISSLSNYIKQNEKKLFFTNLKYAKAFPNSFVIKKRPIKIILYFITLKYAPNILFLKEKIIQQLHKHNAS